MKKEGIIIIQITKKEVEYLLTKGLKFDNFEGDLHKNHSKYKKYYLTETSNNMKLLNDYRQSCIVEK